MELSNYIGANYVGLTPGSIPTIISPPIQSNPTINAAYNGRQSQPNIFNGVSGILGKGQEIIVQLRIEINATLPMTPDSLWNRATGIGQATRDNGQLYRNPQGNPIETSDESDAGVLHESTNPLEPEDKGTDRDRTLIEVFSKIGDYIWRDLNGNGIQELGEPGLPNIPVILYDCNNNIIRTQTSDPSGKYLFDRVILGSYKIKYDISSWGPNYAITFKNQGGDIQKDSDANLNGFTDCFSTSPGPADTSRDAGVLELAEIGDFVWHDQNGDGLQTGESGLVGVQVNLYRSNGSYVATAYSDTNGKYLFKYVYPGLYYLEFQTPAGYTTTFANRPGHFINSDISNNNGPGTTATFNITTGQKDYSWAGGYYKCAPIGELVWYDINKNDVWDSFENGINGLRVNLWKNHSGNWVIWEHVFTGHKPGTPSDDGYWRFCVPPGEYYVEVVMPPLGLVRVLPNRGNDRTKDSDLTNNNGPSTTSKFIVNSGQSKLDIGGGFYPMAVAGKMVWMDTNMNGIQDAGEPKVNNILVQAYEVSTHTKVAESRTNQEGIYELNYLEKKDIYLKFEVPSGYSPTIARAGNDEIDSDVDHTYGPYTTRMFSMLPSMVNENIDMGLAFGVLPVDWLDVSVQKVKGGHEVYWKTASEVNASYYEVERKLENKKDFTSLDGVVKARGNTNQISNYTYLDTQTENPSIYYYRIKQVDMDGQYSYSKIVSINTSGKNQVSLYPNPARTQTNIEINMAEQGEVSIELYDATSKLYKVINKKSLMDGGQHSINLDMTDMPVGIYTVTVKINNDKIEKNLIRIE